MKFVTVTQWVRQREPSNLTRPKASHRAGSRTKVRPSRGRCAKQRRGEDAGRVIEPRKMYSGGQKISPGDRTQSRRCPLVGRQQSCSRQGKRAGHHRGLRAGHGFRGVIRELGRPSRLLGSETAASGVSGTTNTLAWSRETRTDHEPNRTQGRRNTKDNETNQGTGREPEANRPGRTKGVAARHSTAGTGTARRLDHTRGEPRPQGPTLKAARQREGRAGHDLRTRELQE